MVLGTSWTFSVWLQVWWFVIIKLTFGWIGQPACLDSPHVDVCLVEGYCSISWHSLWCGPFTCGQVGLVSSAVVEQASLF